MELAFSWKRKIVQIILEQNIYEKIISNFDRTPVGFTFPNKNIFTDKINESLPVTNVDDKRQVSATFPVSLSGEFLAIELICGGTTDICHPRVSFSNSFHITHSNSYCSNEKNFMNYWQKVIFPFIELKRKELN